MGTRSHKGVRYTDGEKFAIFDSIRRGLSVRRTPILFATATKFGKIKRLGEVCF